MLRGARILLRPVRRSNISYFLKWFNDPEVTQYLDVHFPVNEMAEEQHFERLGSTEANSEPVFIIEVIDNDVARAIGAIGIDEIKYQSQSASFWIALGETEYWGVGYGTEATRLVINYGFQQLNLHRLQAEVFAFNERSSRMCRSIGFKEEGRKRKAVFKNGEYHDLVMFGLLKDEWMEGLHR